jgi:hypothetical protein
VLIFHHHATSLNVVSYFSFLGTNSSIVYDDKENCDHKHQKTKVFVDADVLQPHGVDTDDDHSWLRRNDCYVPMSGITQPTKSYVCNLSISHGEIPNLRESFRSPRKRRGANANNIGKRSCIISVVINFAQILFYTMYGTHNDRVHLSLNNILLTIKYADVIEASPECTGRSVIDYPLSDLCVSTTVG